MWLLDRARLFGGRRGVEEGLLGLLGSAMETLDVAFGRVVGESVSWERVLTILASSLLVLLNGGS